MEHPKEVGVIWCADCDDYVTVDHAAVFCYPGDHALDAERKVA